MPSRNRYKTKDLLLQEEMAGKQLKTPAGLLVHNYEDITTQLAVGRLFFMEIIRNGLMLYEGKGCPFIELGKMTEKQKQEEGQKYFKE